MSTHIQGNLRDLATGPQSILSRIVQERLTGHLMLMSEGGDAQNQELLFIQEGLLLACNSLMGVSIRELLLTDGLVTPEDVKAAEEAVKRENRPGVLPEHILVRDQKVSGAEILATVGTAVKSAALRAMTQPYGLFVFKPADRVAPQRQLSRVPMIEIALAYGREVEGVSELVAAIVSPNHMLALSEKIEQLRSELRFLPQEWKVMFRINGRRTVSEVANLLELERDDFDRLLFTCLVVGAVHPGEVKVPLAGSDPGSARSGGSSSIGPPKPATGQAPPPPTPTLSAEKANPTSAASGPAGPAISPPAKKLPRVLVVDDSRTIQKMVQMALQELELDMEMADDGYEAIRCAEAQMPDLVILDVIMPRLDGYKTCSRLKKLFGSKKIPIIMLTAKDGTFNFIKGKLAGATAYMTKPFEPEELRRTVREYLPAGK